MQAVIALSHSLARLPPLDVHVLARSVRLATDHHEQVNGVNVTWVADPWAKPDYLTGRTVLRRGFARALDQIKPDIVHGHGEAPFIRAALDHAGPSIITLHSIFAEQTRAHGKRAPTRYRIAYALMRRWEAGYIPRIRNLIALNSRIAEYVRERSPNVAISFIKNPVDSGFFDVRDAETKPTILFIGQISRRKGVDVLLAAFDRIASAHPDCKLRIVGDSVQDPAYAAALRDRYQSYVAGQRIVFVGPAQREAVRRELAACSLLCLPSYYEASPVVVIEAMAAAKPVVATRVGDVDELVGASGAGLVVEPGNVDQLASALDAMLRDPERRTATGRRAREVARRTASSEAVASRTLEAYRGVVESRDRSVRSTRAEHPQAR